MTPVHSDFMSTPHFIYYLAYCKSKFANLLELPASLILLFGFERP